MIPVPVFTLLLFFWKTFFFEKTGSYIEVYNEQLDDLLDPSKKDLKMFESKDHGTTVPDLTEITVSTSEEVHHLIERGVANQHIGATLMNLRSSRAHSFFRIVIESRAVSAVDAVDAAVENDDIPKTTELRRAQTSLSARDHWKQVQGAIKDGEGGARKTAKGFYSFLSTNKGMCVSQQQNIRCTISYIYLFKTKNPKTSIYTNFSFFFFYSSFCLISTTTHLLPVHSLLFLYFILLLVF